MDYGQLGACLHYTAATAKVNQMQCYAVNVYMVQVAKQLPILYV